MAIKLKQVIKVENSQGYIGKGTKYKLQFNEVKLKKPTTTRTTNKSLFSGKRQYLSVAKRAKIVKLAAKRSTTFNKAFSKAMLYGNKTGQKTATFTQGRIATNKKGTYHKYYKVYKIELKIGKNRTKTFWIGPNKVYE